MKVLIVTRAIPLHSSAGGMERAAWDLAVAMARMADVAVLTTKVPDRPLTFSHEGVHVTAIHGTRPGKYSARWWQATALQKVAGIDAVLSVSAGATSMVWFQRGPIYVFQAHGTASREFTSIVRSRPRLWALKALRLAYWTVVDRGTYCLSHAVVSIGPAVTRALRSPLYARSFKHTQLRQIPNGIDIEWLTPTQRSEPIRSARFGFVGSSPIALVIARLHKQKGVDLAIDAIARNNANLLIAGSGEERDRLTGYASKLGLGERVRFVGELDRDGVREALEAADVFLFTPRSMGREGLPLSVMEALAANIPVIAPDAPTWPENIRVELSLVAPTDAESIARLVSRSHQLPRTHLAEEYSIHAVAQQYLELIHTLGDSAAG